MRIRFRSVFLALTPWIVASPAPAQHPARSDVYADFNPGQDDPRKSEGWVEVIEILTPPLRSEVRGDVRVTFRAPGMTVARALAWKQPDAANPSPFGHDVILAEMTLGPDGRGEFVFPADDFPNGPVTVRILANNADRSRKDQRELQLINLGGVPWEQGIPAAAPAAAQGMELIFSDDFDRPLSISQTGRGATYTSHKPGGGDFSGWAFSDVESDLNPFHQFGTYLRIRASRRPDGRAGTGLISPVRADFSGVYARIPFYVECRFTAQSAPGTWPAFWTLTRPDTEGADELDIVEAYGGFGKGNPNYTGYSTTSHFWHQKDSSGRPLPTINRANDMRSVGGGASWSTTFHTYGLRVDEEHTIYFLDGIEVMRHPTNALSKRLPHFFLINYAIGGISGWQIDLEREGNATDMYVDYVRMYSAHPAVVVPETPGPRAGVSTRAIGLNFSLPDDPFTTLPDDAVAGDGSVSQTHWNNLPGGGGKRTGLKEHRGARVDGLSAEWEVASGAARSAPDWGFTESNLRLLKGHLAGTGRLEVSRVPFPDYDVFVYLTAGVHSGQGSVTLEPFEGEPRTLVGRVGWSAGRFLASEGGEPEATASVSNVLVFRRVRSPGFVLRWNGNVEGGETGVAGVQIVAAD